MNLYRYKDCGSAIRGRPWSRLIGLAALTLMAGSILALLTAGGVKAAPALSVTQDSSTSVTATLADGGTTVPTSTEWRWFIDTNGQCLARSYDNPPNSRTTNDGETTISLSTGSHDKNVCVQAENNGVTYKGGIAVDQEGPSVVVTQNGETIEIDATDADDNMDKTDDNSQLLPDAAHKANLASGVTCSTTTGYVGTNMALVTTPAPTTSKVSYTVSSHSTSNGNAVCVRVSDKYGNFGYGKMTYDTTLPTLTISQSSQTNLSLQANKRVDWEYSTTDIGDSNCTSVSDNSDYGTADDEQFVNVTIPNGATGFCVEATDTSNGNTAKRLVALVSGWQDVNVSIQQSGPFVIISDPGTGRTVTIDSTPTTGYTALRLTSTNVTSYALIKGYSPDGSVSNQFASSHCSATDNNYWSSNPTKSLWSASEIKSSTGTSIDLSTLTKTYDAICVQIKDNLGYRIDHVVALTTYNSTDPYIKPSARSQFQNSVKVELKNATGASVDYWYRSASLEATNENGCDGTGDAPTRISNSRGKNTINIPESEFFASGGTTGLGRWLCVEVQYSKDNVTSSIRTWVSFGAGQVDSTAPVITISQDQASVTATATDSQSGVKASSWRWAMLPASINTSGAAAVKCDEDSATDTDLTWASGSTATAPSASSRYICFNVEDNSGNAGYNYRYLTRVSDAVKPSLTVTQVGNSFKYTATDAGSGIKTDSHGYLVFATDAKPTDCMSGTTGVDWTKATDGQKTATLTEADNGSHYCFRVSDQAGNYQYAGPVTVAGVDTTAPVVTISQNAGTMTATASESGIKAWQSYQSASEPKCEEADSEWASTKDVTDGRQVTGLTSTDTGNWICFRAQDASDNYGFKKRQITDPTTTVGVDPDPTTPGDDTTSPGQTDDQQTPGPAAPASGVSVSFEVEDRTMRVSLTAESGTAPTPTAYVALYYSVGAEAARNDCKAGGQIDDRNFPFTESRNVVDTGAYCVRVTTSDGANYYGVYDADTGTSVATPGDSTDTPGAVTPAPGTPAEPTTPGTPAEPTTPTTPGTPAEPTTPTTPGTAIPTDTTTTTTDSADPVEEEGFFSKYWIWIVIIVVAVVAAVGIIIVTSSSNRE